MVKWCAQGAFYFFSCLSNHALICFAQQPIKVISLIDGIHHQFIVANNTLQKLQPWTLSDCYDKLADGRRPSDQHWLHVALFCSPPTLEKNIPLFSCCMKGRGCRKRTLKMLKHQLPVSCSRVILTNFRFIHIVMSVGVALRILAFLWAVFHFYQCSLKEHIDL